MRCSTYIKLLLCIPGTNKTNKQADTIMLGWPLNWNMSRDIWRNDLEAYEVNNSKKKLFTYAFFPV